MSGTCHIKNKRGDFDYEIPKFILFEESEYFDQLIYQNKNQNEYFLPENLQYEKSILTLFFSELKKTAEDETSYVDTSLSESILYQLFELSDILKTSKFKIKIHHALKEKGTIDYLVQECQKKGGSKSTKEEEQLIIETINYENIKIFLQSKLNIERKIRILSKIKRDQNIESSIYKYIFNNKNKKNNDNNENNKENFNNDNKKILMILYEEKKIKKEEPILKSELENMIIPRQREMEIKDIQKQNKEEK